MAAKGITLPIIYKSDDSGLRQAQKSLDGFGKTIAGIGAAIAGAFAINKISDFARESILAAEGVATANARIEQIAKSTNVFGNATSQVTDRLIKLAEANEMVIATDAEVIKGVQGQLLSFKALAATATETGGAFDLATMAAFNMAAVRPSRRVTRKRIGRSSVRCQACWARRCPTTRSPNCAPR